MQVHEAQEVLDRAIKDLVERENLIVSEGPAKAFDMHGTPYTMLYLGGVKKEGYPCICRYSELDAHMIPHFLWELQYFLSGRKHIVWRCRPEVVEDIHFGAEVEAKEMIEDGLAPPGTLLVGQKKSYFIGCRLSVY